MHMANIIVLFSPPYRRLPTAQTYLKMHDSPPTALLMNKRGQIVGYNLMRHAHIITHQLPDLKDNHTSIITLRTEGMQMGYYSCHIAL